MRLFDLKDKLPSFWTIQIVVWIVYFVVIYITFLTIAQPENFLSLFFLKGFRALTGFFLTSLILRPIYQKFGKQLSIFRLVSLVLICAVTFGTVWTAIEFSYFYLTSTSLNVSNYLARSPRIALDYAMTLSAWSALYLGIKFWREWQTERDNALQSSALAKTAQLEMLRYQLNPHFLFNALNSIRASVGEDEERTREMITQLSEFLRYSLLSEKEKKIPLHEEVEAVENYLAIEKIRFEEKLEISLDIDESAKNFNIPCFLLNPLVENAVKHGWQTSKKPLQLNISAKVSDNKLLLEVSNSGRLKNDLNDSNTNIGLKNVRQRLENLFGENGKFDMFQDKDFVKARIEIFDETQSNYC